MRILIIIICVLAYTYTVFSDEFVTNNLYSKELQESIKLMDDYIKTRCKPKMTDMCYSHHLVDIYTSIRAEL